MKGLTPARQASRILIYAILLGGVALYLVPVYVVLTTSLKGMLEVSTTSVWAWPTRLNWTNYADAFTRLAPGLRNSFYLTVPATIISAFIGSLNGYTLSKWRFRGADLLFTLILFGMFIPYQSILIPLVRFLQTVKLYGTLGGLIVTHVVYGIPITTLLFRNYYMSVPQDLIQAAKIDGVASSASTDVSSYPSRPPVLSSS